ncbi:MAG TPA: transposase family protein [Chloroflexota bacterium]|nr:transposase family protein [Chloroflexota bacterium]
MTRESIGEYAAKQRERYRRASHSEKSQLLDEVVAVTGFHRKAAIRLLGSKRRRAAGRRSGRPRQYGPDVADAARVVWEAAGFIGAARLHPFVNELLDRLKACGEIRLHPNTEQLLRQASAATLQRLLAPFRSLAPPRGQTITKVGAWLKHQIPVRTFADWNDAKPGFLEIDLVAHCGDSTQGFYLCTLTSVDIATGWVELQAVWGKGQSRVKSGVHAIRRQLPMPLLGLDSDNGSEFINYAFLAYCLQHHITFTRSRPYKKNDSAHVEQKNGALVRHLIGYGRLATKAAHRQLAEVYRLVRLQANFFQPVRQLLEKHHHGAILQRRYDRAQTPFQRVLTTHVLSPIKRQELTALYASLNPLQLQRQLQVELERLWDLVSPPGSPRVPVARTRSVTRTSDSRLHSGNPDL